MPCPICYCYCKLIQPNTAGLCFSVIALLAVARTWLYGCLNRIRKPGLEVTIDTWPMTKPGWTCTPLRRQAHQRPVRYSTAPTSPVHQSQAGPPVTSHRHCNLSARTLLAHTIVLYKPAKSRLFVVIFGAGMPNKRLKPPPLYCCLDSKLLALPIVITHSTKR